MLVGLSPRTAVEAKESTLRRFASANNNNNNNDDDDDSCWEGTVSTNTGSNNQKRLEYEHGFHAGNFADVFKHTILIMMVQHMLQKTKPMAYVETHAGAGLYSLTPNNPNPSSNDKHRSEWTPEYQRGIGALWGNPQTANNNNNNNNNKGSKVLPKAVAAYLAIVQSFQEETVDEDGSSNPPRRLIYPGSPLFAASLLQNHQPNNNKQSHHSLLLYEKAASQFQPLQTQMRPFHTADKLSVHVQCDNGYTGLAHYARSSRTSSPPRALVVIDPPYQYGSDTDQIVALVQDLQVHWRSARIAIWHPVRRDGDNHPAAATQCQRLYQMVRAVVPSSVDILILEVYPPPTTTTTTTTTTATTDRNDDVGTGMILIQPPFGMKDECDDVLPRLYELLCPDTATATSTPRNIDDDNDQPGSHGAGDHSSIHIQWL